MPGPQLSPGLSFRPHPVLCWLFDAVCVLQDPVWLQRAQLFASFMVSPTGRADWEGPDHPASLYEGMAGGICLLAELAAATGEGGGGGAVAGAGLGQQPAPDVQLDAVRRLVAFPLFELFG